MKLLRRSQPEPEPVDEADELRRWEQLLRSHRTWAPRSVVRERYHREARQRQSQTRAGQGAHRATEPPESRSRVCSSAAAPQTHPPNPEPVPSEAPPAPPSEAQHDKALLESWERMRRSFEPLVESNDEPKEYVW